MKRHHSLDFVVGLFVLAGVFAFLLLALKVSGLQDFNAFFGKEDNFVLKANFSNIGGLKPRSRVTIGGVNIGRVKNITLDEKTGNYDAIVELGINPELANKIPDDSSASIRTAGLIGDNFIAIAPGGSDTYYKTGDLIEETNSAMVLEDLINKYLFSKTTEPDKSSATVAPKKTTTSKSKDEDK